MIPPWSHQCKRDHWTTGGPCPMPHPPMSQGRHFCKGGLVRLVSTGNLIYYVLAQHWKWIARTRIYCMYRSPSYVRYIILTNERSRSVEENKTKSNTR